MRQGNEELAAAAGAVPRDRSAWLDPDAGITLDELIRAGLKVSAARPFLGKVRVRFARLDGPFRVHPATGWEGVRVRASTGAESVLLYQDGKVSGMVRLRPRPKGVR